MDSTLVFRRLVRLAPVALALVALAVPSAASARIVERLDFDSGNLHQWAQIQARSGQIRIVRHPRHQGRYAARFVVRPGINTVGGSGDRAEVAGFGRIERRGMTSWWKWSTLFPRSFRVGRYWWNTFTQWHNTGLSCQPNIAFDVDHYVTPAKLRLIVNGGGLNTATCHSTQRVFSLGRLVRGRWQTFVFHVHWSPYRSRGFVAVWRNGHRKVRAHVATLYFGQGAYVKQGLYRAHESWTTTIYHDGLRRFNRRPRSFR